MRNTELTSARDTALVSAYRDTLNKLGKNAPFVPKKQILQWIIQGKAPRFYCSAEEASRVCSLLLRGKASTRKGLRNDMYKDLSAVVAAKMQHAPLHTFQTALTEAIEEPAPQWYLGIESALRIINRSFKRKE